MAGTIGLRHLEDEDVIEECCGLTGSQEGRRQRIGKERANELEVRSMFHDRIWKPCVIQHRLLLPLSVGPRIQCYDSIPCPRVRFPDGA